MNCILLVLNIIFKLLYPLLVCNVRIVPQAII